MASAMAPSQVNLCQAVFGLLAVMMDYNSLSSARQNGKLQPGQWDTLLSGLAEAMMECMRILLKLFIYNNLQHVPN